MQLLMLAGNVGKDAKLNHPQSGGDAVLNFSLAVDNGKDRDGNSRPATWYDCAIWGKRAEALEKYILKGTKLSVSGRPSVRVHEGKAYLGITIDGQLTFHGSSAARSDERPASDSGGGTGSAGAGTGGMDDDIPFAAEFR
jgi:single-strand DNA-binding protein